MDLICFYMAVVASSSAYVFPLCIHNLYIRLGGKKGYFESQEGFTQCVFPHCMNVLSFVCDGSVKDMCCQNVFFFFFCSQA